MKGDLGKLIVAGLACLLATSTQSSAGGLSIWPLQVNLDDVGGIQEINVTNPTDEASFVQVTAVEWHEPGRADEADRVDSVLAVPPIFELPPNSKQLVRIASREPIDNDVERAYRLVITEVPRTAGLVPNSLAIAARMTLPIFVTPTSAAPAPVWSISASEFSEPQLVLTNQGNASIKVRKVELIDSDGGSVTFSTAESSLILAGREMRWPLDVDASRLKGKMVVRAQTTIGVIEDEILLAGG